MSLGNHYFYFIFKETKIRGAVEINTAVVELRLEYIYSPVFILFIHMTKDLCICECKKVLPKHPIMGITASFLLQTIFQCCLTRHPFMRRVFCSFLKVKKGVIRPVFAFLVTMGMFSGSKL